MLIKRESHLWLSIYVMKKLFQQYTYLFLAIGGYFLLFFYPYLIGNKQVINLYEIPFQLLIAVILTFLISTCIYKDRYKLSAAQKRQLMTGFVCIAIIFSVYNPLTLPVHEFAINRNLRIVAYVIVLWLVFLGAKQKVGFKRLLVFLLPGLLSAIFYEDTEIFAQYPNLVIYAGLLLAFIWWLVDFRRYNKTH